MLYYLLKVLSYHTRLKKRPLAKVSEDGSLVEESRLTPKYRTVYWQYSSKKMTEVPITTPIHCSKDPKRIGRRKWMLHGFQVAIGVRNKKPAAQRNSIKKQIITTNGHREKRWEFDYAIWVSVRVNNCNLLYVYRKWQDWIIFYRSPYSRQQYIFIIVKKLKIKNKRAVGLSLLLMFWLSGLSGSDVISTIRGHAFFFSFFFPLPELPYRCAVSWKTCGRARQSKGINIHVCAISAGPTARPHVRRGYII